MDITRYIIWTTKLEDTNSIIKSLSKHTTVIVSITDTIVCLESILSQAKIREFVGVDMEMACLEIDETFIEKLIKTKFKDEEKKNFIRFLNLTKTPTSIDEALDLINERGGLEFLNERERFALSKLTSK